MTSPNLVDHPQVLAWHNSVWVHIDRDIAPLLQALWDRGLDTSYSCQGHDFSPAYILFPHDADAETFESRLWLYDIHRTVDQLVNGTRVMFAANDLPEITEAWT